jgi:hypothetical protein
MEILKFFLWLLGCSSLENPEESFGVPEMSNPPPPPPKKFTSIRGYDRYRISRYGKIVNWRTGRILKTRIANNGLEKVNLFDGKKQKTFYVHRLVLSSFTTSEDLNIKHKDENKRNNCLDNLEYDYDTPFHKPKEGVSHKMVVNKSTGEEYESIREASEALNMNYGNLSAMLSGKSKNTTDLCLKM